MEGLILHLLMFISAHNFDTDVMLYYQKMATYITSYLKNGNEVWHLKMYIYDLSWVQIRRS